MLEIDLWFIYCDVRTHDVDGTVKTPPMANGLLMLKKLINYRNEDDPLGMNNMGVVTNVCKIYHALSCSTEQKVD